MNMLQIHYLPLYGSQELRYADISMAVSFHVWFVYGLCPGLSRSGNSDLLRQETPKAICIGARKPSIEVIARLQPPRPHAILVDATQTRSELWTLKFKRNVGASGAHARARESLLFGFGACRTYRP